MKQTYNGAKTSRQLLARIAYDTATPLSTAQSLTIPSSSSVRHHARQAGNYTNKNNFS